MTDSSITIKQIEYILWDIQTPVMWRPAQMKPLYLGLIFSYVTLDKAFNAMSSEQIWLLVT